MMFVFLAIKESEGKRLADMLRGGWKGIGRPVIYGLLGGLFLWLYMLTWAGALLFALILFIFIVVQAVLDHLHGRPLDYLGILGACLFGISLALYLPWIKNAMTVLSLIIGLLGSVLLVVISSVMSMRSMKPLAYPLGLAGLTVAGILTLAIVSPAMLQNMFSSIANMFTWHTATTVSEEQPLLIEQGNFTFAVAAGDYMLAFFFSLICIVVLLYQVIKKGQPDKTLLLVWSVAILLSALAMRRSAYYYAVNVALLTSYLCWVPLNLLLQGKETAAAVTALNNSAAKGRRRAGQSGGKPRIKRNTVFIAILLAIIVLLVYYPNIGPLPGGQRLAIDMAMHPPGAPSDAWCESMDWLRASTPEPFDTPEAYYGLHKPVNAVGGFEYPASAYGALAWWDYGYWIARMGHRAPSANPGTGTQGEAYYLTAQDELSASNMINTWGARYVIVDSEIADIDRKFHALATLSGSSSSKYYEEFLQKQGNQYVSMLLYYPQYYRSMVSRLYNFDGKAVIPDTAYVLACKEITVQGGRSVKEITEFKTFSSYGEAEAFMLANKNKDYILVGQDPYKSCVPLEELKGYKLVYSSSQKVTSGSKSQSNVKIFEYDKDALPPAVR
jgi:dolichyl-diphosphooligosaccharide--protein glycosyltransferase